MKLERSLIDHINIKLKEVESLYHIKVLCWYCRGSLGMGRHRRNSDFDIGFIFLNLSKQNMMIHAVHDIVGWGVDAWGWSIEDALKCIEDSQKLLSNGLNELSVIYPNREYARVEFNYFNDIYMCVDNPISEVGGIFRERVIPVLKDIMEIPLIINYTLHYTKKMIVNPSKGYLTSTSNYLKGIWYLLICKSFICGDYMKIIDVVELARIHCPAEVIKTIETLRNRYMNALTKNSQELKSTILDDYTIKEYQEIMRIFRKSAPKHSLEYVLGKTNEIRKSLVDVIEV